MKKGKTISPGVSCVIQRANRVNKDDCLEKRFQPQTLMKHAQK